jgi:His Kinase A (phospho-acceptor) domain
MSIRGRWWALSSFVQWRFIFKKLRTSTKLLLLCSMFGISIVVTTAALVAEKQIAIAFAHKELVGSRYLAIVRDIYPAILSLQTDPSFQSKPELLRALAAAENDASGRLQTAALQKTLAASLRELWDGKSKASENERVVLEALSNTRRLASRIGDDSNLALDSNLDSYHVQNIVVERLPALVSQLGEMQTFLRAASSTEAVSSAQAARLALLDTSIRIRSTIDGVKSDLEAAYRGNADGSVRRNIDAAIMTMIARVESYLSTIESGSPDAEGKVDPASLEDAFSSAVGSAIRAWAIVQAELERLVQERIAELGWKLSMSLALIVLLAGLSILLAVMTHQHIVSSLGHLEGIVARVRDLKASNVSSDRKTGDEFSKLTVAFNYMLAELAAAHEREIADQSRSARQSLLVTMGQMAASIVHELNQPLAAIVANGNAGLRWLAKATPDLDEARAALKRVVSDGHRASQVIGTIRSIFKKDGQKKSSSRCERTASGSRWPREGSAAGPTNIAPNRTGSETVRSVGRSRPVAAGHFKSDYECHRRHGICSGALTRTASEI